MLDWKQHLCCYPLRIIWCYNWNSLEINKHDFWSIDRSRCIVSEREMRAYSLVPGTEMHYKARMGLLVPWGRLKLEREGWRAAPNPCWATLRPVKGIVYSVLFLTWTCLVFLLSSLGSWYHVARIGSCGSTMVLPPYQSLDGLCEGRWSCGLSCSLLCVGWKLCTV